MIGHIILIMGVNKPRTFYCVAIEGTSNGWL